MRLLLTGRQVEVTSALRQLIERKIAKIDRMLNDSIVSTQVVLSRQKHRHVVEISIHARGDHRLHGIGSATGWTASVKEAVEKTAQQGHKLKDKWDKRKRRASSARALTGTTTRPAAARGTAPRRVVRALRYVVKPMTVEDATLQVESGDETFLVFRNANTDAVNILYRRKDGHFGLIEPDR